MSSTGLIRIKWSICGVAGVLSALADVFANLDAPPPRLSRRQGIEGRAAGELDSGPGEGQFFTRGNPTVGKKITRIIRFFDLREVEKQCIDGPGTRQRTVFIAPGARSRILGWLVGVKDILARTFTAIDKHGHLVVQQVDAAGRTSPVMGLFEAIGCQFGHLKSDVATPAGLPVPLMPLLQFPNSAASVSGHRLAKSLRIMYRSGYDFRQFLAMSVALLVEEYGCA